MPLPESLELSSTPEETPQSQGPEKSHPSLIGRIIDTFTPGLGIPFDLYRKMPKVMEPYREVLEGKVANPSEVKRITGEFNDWLQEVRDYL